MNNFFLASTFIIALTSGFHLQASERVTTPLDHITTSPGKLFVISGPSGVGKSTLVAAALASLEATCKINRIVTYTTRNKRAHEIPGIDYIFVTKEEFERLNSNHFFLEATEYGGNWYGSPQDFLPLLEQGESFIIITDRNGLAFYKKLFEDRDNIITSVWILPPSLDALTERLTKRGETSPTLERRISMATIELDQEHKENRYDTHIINNNLKIAQSLFEGMLLQALGLEKF